MHRPAARKVGVAACGSSSEWERRSTHGRTSRAVSRNRSSGIRAALGVQADRFDYEVEFIGAVDFASHAVGHSGPDAVSFGEVMKPVNTLRVAILHEEHGARQVFRPREQNEMIGAEVEHGQGGKTEEAGA